MGYRLRVNEPPCPSGSWDLIHTEHEGMSRWGPRRYGDARRYEIQVFDGQAEHTVPTRRCERADPRRQIKVPESTLSGAIGAGCTHSKPRKLLFVRYAKYTVGIRLLRFASVVHGIHQAKAWRGTRGGGGKIRFIPPSSKPQLSTIFGRRHSYANARSEIFQTPTKRARLA